MEGGWGDEAKQAKELRGRGGEKIGEEGVLFGAVAATLIRACFFSDKAEAR